MVDNQPHADLKELERFVVENDELLELEALIGRFNVFDALGVTRRELQHSNFLAWLINPAESHGQGDLFLKALLMDLLRRAREGGVPVPVSPVELDGSELIEVEIRREWKNIDLLILCQSPRFVIAIENKVDSGEHSDQLQRYEDAVRTESPWACAADKPCGLFVFLTREGEEASDQDWVAYSYKDVHRVFTRVRKMAAGSLGGDVGTFIDHYLNLIGSRFMDNPEIDRLCKHIYANHRRAIDLIVEHRPTPELELLDAIEARLHATPDKWMITRRRTRFLNAVPPSWRQILPPLGASRSNEPWEWITNEVWAEPGVIWFTVYAGPTIDAAARSRVINALFAEPELQFGTKSSKTLENEWRRLVRKTSVRWRDDEFDAPVLAEQVIGQMNAMHPRLLRAGEIIRQCTQLPA